MSKPKVQIKQWGIYGYSGDRRLEGVAIDHPRFPENTSVTTSRILKPTESKELRNLHDGDTVETRNTIYILVGENVNTAS